MFAEDEAHASEVEESFWQKLERAHVMELYSPPRIAAWAEKLGLRSGGSLDLATGWDFDRTRDVKRMWELLEWQDPDLVTTSPPCDPFSPIQALNKGKYSAEEWEAIRGRGLRHLRVCMQVCKRQYDRGRYFLHEHPYPASSWREPMVDEVLALPRTILILSHMCKFGKVAARQLSDGVTCLLYTSPSPRDRQKSRMPSSA